MVPQSLWGNGTSQQIISVATVTTIAALAGAYLYYRKRTTNIPKNWTPVTRVQKLFIYPLKSGRRREVQSMYCTEVGPTFTENNTELRDRSFIVYGEQNNSFKTARTFPKLVLIQTSADNNGNLVLTAPEQDPLVMKFPDPKSKPIIVTIHQQAPVGAVDCGDEVAVWLSRYLLNESSGMRLGYYRSDFKRDLRLQTPKYFGAYVNFRVESAGVFADLTSYHLINQSSVDALNKTLDEPISANNFRPNILVESKNLEAFGEENWDWIKIGDTILRNVKLCTRCVLTTVDPERGVLSKQREPLKSLEQINNLKDPAHIKCEGKKGVLGIQMELWKTGQIRVGDEVFVA